MTSKIKRFDIHAKSLRLMLKFALFILYLSFLCYGMFFADSFGRTSEHAAYNMHPTLEIMRVIRYADTLGWEFVMLNLIGNVVAFMPFGFIIASFLPKGDKRHPIGIAGLSLLLSFSLEHLQYYTQAGAADIDDVILNTIGGFAGYVVYMIYWRMSGHNE